MKNKRKPDDATDFLIGVFWIMTLLLTMWICVNSTYYVGVVK
jgi:hypothetical protein